MENQHDLAKWLAGEMTQDELRAFEQSEDFKLFEKIAGTSAQLKTPDWDENAALQKIYTEPKKEIPVRTINHNKKWWYSAAAILVLALGIFMFQENGSQTETLIAQSQVEKSLLPDASVVYLNKGSEMKFSEDSWKSNRVVNLDGEAYFQVAKGKTFDVVTNNGTVRVLGTQFNVKEFDDIIEVTCYEGRVAVNSGKNNVELKAGDFVRFNNGKLETEKTINNTNPNWVLDQIRVEAASFAQIVEEIETSYNISIETNFKTDKTFSGSLPTNNLQEAMNIVCTAYNLNAKTVKNKVVLSVNE